MLPPDPPPTTHGTVPAPPGGESATPRARRGPTPRTLAAMLAALTLPAVAVLGAAIAYNMPQPERSLTPAQEPLRGTDLARAALRQLQDASTYRISGLVHEGDGSGPYQDRPTDTRRALGVSSLWLVHTSDPTPAVLVERVGDGASPTRMWVEGTPVISWSPDSHDWFHDDPAYDLDEEYFLPAQSTLEAVVDHAHITDQSRAVFRAQLPPSPGGEGADHTERPGVRLQGSVRSGEETTEFVLFTTVKGTPLGLSAETTPTGTAQRWTRYGEYEIHSLDEPVDLTVPAPDEIGPWEEAGGP